MCCRLSGLPLSPDCGTCGQRQLRIALNSQKEGHRFICRLGVHNFWFPIRVRGTTIGVAYVQALANPRRTPPACRPFARAARSHGKGPPRPGNDHADEAPKVMSRSEFDRAAKFLQLIVEHVQTADLADLRQEDLTKARQALRVFENVQARLRKELNAVLPALRQIPPVLQLESRPELIVHSVLDRIYQDYAQPLTLKKCARDLQLNATYLSHLFSCTVGLPFKTCLTEVRVEKAQELLGDPARSISQVASAVGYTSENRFRIVFKKATGLSPRIWRETLRMSPPA